MWGSGSFLANEAMWKSILPGEESVKDAIQTIAARMAPAVRAKIRLPNVVGVGSGRCGTSYLFGLLAGHRDFYVTPLKEVNYFGIKQAPFVRGGWSIEDYRLCFSSQADQKYIAEISPVYLAYPPAIQQIAMTLKKVRVVVTLRNPMTRFLSHFTYHRHLHRYEDVNCYAEDALRLFIPGYFDYRWASPEKAIQLSLYSAGMKAAIDAVGRENVLVLVYEDLVENELIWRRELSVFFDGDFTSVDVPAYLRNASRGSAATDLSDKNRSALMAIFTDDSARLTNLIGRDMGRVWSQTR